MDRDRIESSARALGGRVKAFFGRMFGDTIMHTDGRMDQAKGSTQNAVGGMKDSLREDARH
jgi:uncharacterized protein YjbJ (UPF0337 family)